MADKRYGDKYIDPPEEWKPVPVEGFAEIYEVSNLGRVRRAVTVRGTMKGTILATFIHKFSGGSKRNIVRMNNNYKRAEATVSRLVYAAFRNGGKPLSPKVNIVHKNGLLTDDRLINLVPMNKKELGMLCGSQSNRRPVVRILPDGTEDECYPSARQAAKANYCSYQTVMDRCNGKVKNPFALGYDFRWDDE